MGRNSILIKAARYLQSATILLKPIDRLIGRAVSSKANGKIIVLLAPPRSGSTLTYQILTTGIESNYLSNASNFLFPAPIIGNIITGQKTAKKSSNFSSEYGFVSGLFGEAEGMKYWQYWINQGLEEQEALFFEKERLNRLKIALKKTIYSGKPMIWGYLGHVFCFEHLLKIFADDIVFIHLKRDFLSNAYSIYKASPKKIISSQSLQLMKQAAMPFSTMHQNAAIQVTSIHNRINLKKKNKKNFIEVNYEDICADPHNFLDNLKIELEKRNFTIKLRKERIPKRFKFSIISPDLNEDTKKISDAILKQKV